MRRGFGAGLARDPSNSGHRFPLKFFASVVTLGEARHDCFSQCNTGADVV